MASLNDIESKLLNIIDVLSGSGIGSMKLIPIMSIEGTYKLPEGMTFSDVQSMCEDGKIPVLYSLNTSTGKYRYYYPMMFYAADERLIWSRMIYDPTADTWSVAYIMQKENTDNEFVEGSQNI